MRYWLMKSEPSVFAIEDLALRPRQTESWDGVRNYQARNFLRDGMRRGDLALFYHSSCAEPGAAGIVRIVRAGHPDASARNRRSPHFDPRSTSANPVWFCVDVKLVRTFAHVVPLHAIRNNPALRHMPLVQRGSRLSIMPVTAAEWRAILAMETGAARIEPAPPRRKSS
jgi:predicted RNA-binding protein with PUA-like domain